MIEVEAKFKISDPKPFRLKARHLGKFIGKENKIDDYYTLSSLNKYSKKSLRIREKKEYYEVNFKKGLSYTGGVHAKNEIEFRVSNISGFLELIKDLGFRKWLSKEKISEVYRIKDNFSIEINNVRGLGWFIEVEYLAKPKEIARARKAVIETAKKLGLKDKDAVKAGYTKLLWNKKRN